MSHQRDSLSGDEMDVKSTMETTSSADIDADVRKNDGMVKTGRTSSADIHADVGKMDGKITKGTTSSAGIDTDVEKMDGKIMMGTTSSVDIDADVKKVSPMGFRLRKKQGTRRPASYDQVALDVQPLKKRLSSDRPMNKMECRDIPLDGEEKWKAIQPDDYAISETYPGLIQSQAVVITGLPGDVRERELFNICRWWTGFVEARITFEAGLPIGFALFDSVRNAQEAAMSLQNLSFDPEGTCILQAKMLDNYEASEHSR